MKIKKYVLTVSRNFLKGHPREGEPTGFVEAITEGRKIHTIRAGAYWAKVVIEVNAGLAVLCVRYWSGKPYGSKQVDVTTFTKLGWQPISIQYHGIEKIPFIMIKNTNPIIRTVGHFLHIGQTVTLAHNDGLALEDFIGWFKNDVPEAGIIHFTDLRY